MGCCSTRGERRVLLPPAVQNQGAASVRSASSGCGENVHEDDGPPPGPVWNGAKAKLLLRDQVECTSIEGPARLSDAVALAGEYIVWLNAMLALAARRQGVEEKRHTRLVVLTCGEGPYDLPRMRPACDATEVIGVGLSEAARSDLRGLSRQLGAELLEVQHPGDLQCTFEKLAQRRSEPINVVIVLDLSDAVQGDTKKSVLDGLDSLLAPLDENDNVLCIGYSARPALLTTDQLQQ